LPIDHFDASGMSVDLLCFSHLRWDFVFQRPNHLMTRAARSHRVFYVEEPVHDAAVPHMSVTMRDGVAVVVPHLPPEDRDEPERLRRLLDDLRTRYGIQPDAILWYYTPMAMPWSEHLQRGARLVIYDCMDHLAGFRGAPPGLLQLEAALLARADLVFTGGHSLYEAKRSAHPSVHRFSSSVDVAHFRKARGDLATPPDQRDIAHPRVGYFGVLDERIDWPLVGEVSRRRPEWQLILVGPTAKVDPAELPVAPNLHYLGPKPYADLPSYLAGWDAAMMPFARNEATRYISPTKTPEYLAGGRAVASTSIRDVVHPYGDRGLVHIGDSPEEFIVAVTRALDDDPADLQERADAFLAGMSWDATWAAMRGLMAPFMPTADRSARPTHVEPPMPAAAAFASTAETPAVAVGARRRQP
jgi:UDP-galactopyranose mutase